MSRLSHACRFAGAAVLALGFAKFAAAAPQEPSPPPASASEMKPYVETVAGTDVKFEMVPIPGGEFVMGSPADEAKRNEDEGPQHPVKIAPFWMGKYEVTWDEYDQFAFSLDLKKKKRDGVDPAGQPESEKKADAVTRPTPPYADETFGFGRKGQPVICVTHHAAMEYTRWLSAKTGKTYRLPTEAEWEYACRAGTKSAYFYGDDPGQLGDYAWYVENAEKPQPIGKKKPNPWGLYDIHGNVAEWCLDHYIPESYKPFAATNSQRSARSFCPMPRSILTWPAAARGMTTPIGFAVPRGKRRTPSGASRIPSGPRASGGTPTQPLLASGLSGP